jgi:predicted metal-binding protein
MSATDGTMSNAAVSVFVCVTCKLPNDGSLSRGRMLFDAVTASLNADMAAIVTVTPVECLAVCKRPCTIALSGPGKWTCVVGDLDPGQHAGDVIAAALSFAATDNGIIPWRQRPLAFRKGVVARIPPLDFRPALGES